MPVHAPTDGGRATRSHPCPGSDQSRHGKETSRACFFSSRRRHTRLQGDWCALPILTLNTGVALDRQGTNVDSSVAGQAFAGAAYAGVSSPKLGTLTFGRHTGLLADGVGKYDPLTASNAFSVIGFSGAAAGGGNTENRRLDSSLKYVGKYGPVRAGAQYQLNGSTGSAGSAWELELGFDFAGASLDAFYMNKKDAIGT